MVPFLAVFLISLVAATALAFAIHYFLRLGPWPSLGFALLAVGAFLLFCLSGLWADADRYDWGSLTPIFALILLGCFGAVKFGKRLWAWWQRKLKNLLG